MIKDLRTKLRETSDEDEFQQTLGVILYLSELKVGSIVDTPDGRGVVVELYAADVWFVYIKDKGVFGYATGQFTVVG